MTIDGRAPRNDFIEKAREQRLSDRNALCVWFEGLHPDGEARSGDGAMMRPRTAIDGIEQGRELSEKTLVGILKCPATVERLWQERALFVQRDAA
jgi:hypothetical protein